MKKFQYAPGLPGYGTQGADGDDGLLGMSIYFSEISGAQSSAIQPKIEANEILNGSGDKLPGYPTRKYQSGDVFIDPNGLVYEIDLELVNKFQATGERLNTSTIFVQGLDTSTDIPFTRYHNAYTTEKFLLDNVFAASGTADYTQSPGTANGIYGLPALNFAQIKYVDASVNGYLPYTIWNNTIDTDSPEKAIALVKEYDSNTWRWGNANGGAVRDVSLVLDFGDVYIGGTNGSGTIYGTFVGAITTDNLDLTGWLSVGGDASFNDVFADNTDLNSLDVGGDVNLGSANTHSVKLRGDVVTVANSGSAGMNLKFASASAFGNQVMGMEPLTPPGGDPRSLTIVGQDNASIYPGGALTVRGGQNTSDDGGALNLYGGAGKTTSAGTGGKATLRGGSAYSAGDVDILGGGGEYAGDVRIFGGGGTSAGDVLLQGGSGVSSGDVNIFGGAGPSNGEVNIGTATTSEVNIGGGTTPISLNGVVTASGNITSTTGNITASSGNITAGGQIKIANGTQTTPSIVFGNEADDHGFFFDPAAHEVTVRIPYSNLTFAHNSYPSPFTSTDGILIRGNNDIAIWPDNENPTGEKVIIHAGNSTSTGGTGGELYLYGGDAGGDGGDVSIRGGNGSLEHRSGKVNIKYPVFETLYHQKMEYYDDTDDNTIFLSAATGSMIVSRNVTDHRTFFLPLTSDNTVNPGATVTFHRMRGGGFGGGVKIKPRGGDMILLDSETIDSTNTHKGVSITDGGSLTFVCLGNVWVLTGSTHGWSLSPT